MCLLFAPLPSCLSKDVWTHGKAEVGRVREEKVRRKKMQVRQKVEKSRSTVFFQCIGAPEGRQVGSLKRRVRSHLADVEVKIYKTPHDQISLEVEMSKKCRAEWPGAHLGVKSVKN